MENEAKRLLGETKRDEWEQDLENKMELRFDEGGWLTDPLRAVVNCDHREGDA